MLRKIRIVLAALCFIGITLLFLDVTGTLHRWLGFLADIQFLPAFLALNVAVVVVMLLLTLIFGRVYCSVICPLGIMQDIISFFGSKKKKNRFTYKKEHKWLRYSILVIFCALLAAGINSIVILIAPYSAYGRIASNLFAPVYAGANNLLAMAAEHFDSYAFYSTDVWLKSLPTFIIAAFTFIIIFVMAFKGGRSWCNNICPVGSFLGLISRYAIFRPVFDLEKCNGCTLCARKCKASCIDPKAHKVDMSRCVACMDCLTNCHQGAISFKPVLKCKSKNDSKPDTSKRAFLAITAMVASAATVEAAEKKIEETSAALQNKSAHTRKTSPKPAGSKSIKHFDQHCTGCQLCVANCPNGVLRPSAKFGNLMQPEMSFERGYCRPECTKCSEVCPSGAICKITAPQKSSTQIGHAVWVKESCVVITDKVSCGNCARHCPAGAIRMVANEFGKKLKVPSVNAEKCIGCGSCEYHCPALPVSAIYVEGHDIHREI